jgi:uncharacterized protein (TIGR00299 family) protein
MGRLVYFDCPSGASGDMILGALVDAGVSVEALRGELDKLGLPGWTLGVREVRRGAFRATKVDVKVDPDVPRVQRHLADITGILGGSGLAPGLVATATRIFARLAEAEARVHGTTVDEVHFHEVGAIDAIVDVVGVCAALDALGVDRVISSPIAVGHGTVRTSHGDLPNPPPAVARLLATRDVPIVGVDTTMEISTPTGVALLVALADCFGALPAVAVESAGWGAGTADPAGRPNVVQVLIGTPAAAATAPRPGRTAVVLEVNVDDVTGEVLAHTVAALLAAGAHDAWAAPIVMKKGRPAHTVAVLVDPADVDRLATVLVAETGSLGLRATTVERWPQRRAEATIDVGGHRIRVKVADGRAKPEHDDAVAAARALGRPLRDVLRDAETRALDGDPQS